MMAGDDALAREHADEAMSLADSLGDPYLSALARCQDAWVLTEGARWSEALAILDEVVPGLRDLGAWDVAIAANRTRAWMYEELGDRDRALILYTENLEQSRAHGHRRIEARSLGVLAEMPQMKVASTKPASSSWTRSASIRSSETFPSLASISSVSPPSTSGKETRRSLLG